MGTVIPTITAPSGARTILGPLSGDYFIGSAGFNQAMGKAITFSKVVNKVMRPVKEVSVEGSVAQSLLKKECHRKIQPPLI